MSPRARVSDDLAMGDPRRPGGDEEMAVPAAAADEPEPEAEPEALDDEVVVTRTRGRPARRPSDTAMFRGAVLVLLIAMLVLSWFTLTSTNQVRDQYTLANGLQRCLITAQLNENQTTDPSGTAYKAAVQTCLSK